MFVPFPQVNNFLFCFVFTFFLVSDIVLFAHLCVRRVFRIPASPPPLLSLSPLLLLSLSSFHRKCRTWATFS